YTETIEALVAEYAQIRLGTAGDCTREIEVVHRIVIAPLTVAEIRHTYRKLGMAFADSEFGVARLRGGRQVFNPTVGNRAKLVISLVAEVPSIARKCRRTRQGCHRVVNVDV